MVALVGLEGVRELLTDGDITSARLVVNAERMDSEVALDLGMEIPIGP